MDVVNYATSHQGPPPRVPSRASGGVWEQSAMARETELDSHARQVVPGGTGGESEAVRILSKERLSCENNLFISNPLPFFSFSLRLIATCPRWGDPSSQSYMWVMCEFFYTI